MDESNKPDLSLKTNDFKTVLRTNFLVLGLAIIYFGLIIGLIVAKGNFIPNLPILVSAVFLGFIFIVLGREKGLIVKIDNNRLKIGIYKNDKEKVKSGKIKYIAYIVTSLYLFIFGLIIFFVSFELGYFLGMNPTTGELTNLSVSMPIWIVSTLVSIVFFIEGVTVLVKLET